MPDIITYRRAVQSDIAGILALQKANLYQNLDEQGRHDGFLSIALGAEQFNAINRDLVVVVACSGTEVLGFLCAATWRHALQFPILKLLTEQTVSAKLDGTGLAEHNTCIYGPVCVAKAARGTGILEGLYASLKAMVPDHYAFCALFIADGNTRSMRAHLRMGMSPLGSFCHNDTLYHAFGGPLHP